MADTSNVDAAVIAKLKADAQLMTLLPHGVHFGVAPNGKTKFVVVSQQTHFDSHAFSGRALETLTYQVRAVVRDDDGTVARGAAARIDAALHDAPLVIDGYDHMLSRRTERIRYPDVDEIDTNIRWEHRGGVYEVVVSPQ